MSGSAKPCLKKKDAISLDRIQDRAAILRDRERGHSLGQLAKSHGISRTTVHRVLRQHASTTALEKSA